MGGHIVKMMLNKKKTLPVVGIEPGALAVQSQRLSDCAVLFFLYYYYYCRFRTSLKSGLHVLKKAYTPSLPPRCPFCACPIPGNLQHLIWHCPKFARYRTFKPPPNALASYIDPHTLEPSTLASIARFSLKSGLARAV